MGRSSVLTELSPPVGVPCIDKFKVAEAGLSSKSWTWRYDKLYNVTDVILVTLYCVFQLWAYIYTLHLFYNSKTAQLKVEVILAELAKTTSSFSPIGFHAPRVNM
jgi:hypothetical protein